MDVCLNGGAEQVNGIFLKPSSRLSASKTAMATYCCVNQRDASIPKTRINSSRQHEYRKFKCRHDPPSQGSGFCYSWIDTQSEQPIASQVSGNCKSYAQSEHQRVRKHEWHT